MRRLGIGGLAATWLYFVGSHALSFIREGASCLNQRHLVRMMRIALWSNDGKLSAKDIATLIAVTTPNSFYGIDPAKSGVSQQQSAADTLVKLVRELKPENEKEKK